MALNRTSRGPRPPSAPADAKAFRIALRLFKEAAARVPAYKDFLKKARINPAHIATRSDFAQIPLTDKPNYISKYSLEQLSWDGTLDGTRFISSSSGSTGVPFYWPRGNTHDVTTGLTFRYIYESIFGTKKGSTLFINMFALGTWLAGLQFYDGAKRVADAGNEIVIVTPGIEKTTAIEAIQRLSPFFDRIVLAGYPPFIKDVLDFGAKAGIQWKKLDVRLLTAGESFSEMWRDHVLGIIGKKGSYANLINVYGMAEVGVVAHETPLSVAARKASGKNAELGALLNRDGQLCPLYQYDPAVRYFEAVSDDSLALTSDAGLPLIRYNTRDRGALLPYDTVAGLAGPALVKAAAQEHIPLPFVYLFGRRDLSISFYALNVYVENIKQALETLRSAPLLSGLFVMNVVHTRTLDQQFAVTVELARGVLPRDVDAKMLARHIVETLCAVNSEYAKLHATLGARARPKVILVPHGKIETVPGRKHKWVRSG